MNQSIYNQDMNRIEISVLDYLEYNKIFFEPQKLLGQRIGFSRQGTNMAIQSLKEKGLITVSRGKNFNRRLRLIALSAKAVSGLGANE